MATKPRLVLIEWLDSRQPESQWQYTSDVKGGGHLVCRSVGWLLKDSKKTKVLAQNFGDDAQQVSGVMRIPTCCVVWIKDMTVVR